MPILGIMASQKSAHLVTYISRPLGTFTTAAYSNPYGNWTFFQSNSGTGFSAANVLLLTGSYNSNYTTNGNTYSLANGGASFTSRTTYPTSIFQTSMVNLNSKTFVLGGNGLNGTPGGGTTANVYYMGTGLNSWTAGTSLPSSGNSNAGYSPYNIIIKPSNSNIYRGNGISGWTQISSLPTSSTDPYPIGDRTYVITSTATYYSANEGTTWINANITPPISTLPNRVVGPSPDNTGTSIYYFYNTEYNQTPSAYYFSGQSFTLTNNFGTERTDGNGSAIFAMGIVGNQITMVFGASEYRYATIN